MADDAGAVRRTPRPAPEPDAEELVNQTEMLGFGVERGVATLSLKPPREIVLAWVAAAREMLGDAPNYSETRIDFPTEKAEMEVSAAGEVERFVFTVQRAGKLTPHEARRKAEAERDEAVALCANLQSTLLSRLAELTEAAGKQRSTEWLRTCSTLPMEEWPPAPAYKGPMVPAAELAEAKRQHAELLAQRDSWWDHVGREQSKVTAERDALQARLKDALAELAKYEPKPGCCTACNGDGTVPTGYPCEDCYATGHSHSEEVSCDGQPAATEHDELTWRRLRMDEVLAEIDNYSGPTDPAELPEDGDGLNILDRIRALMHPAEPTGEVEAS